MKLTTKAIEAVSNRRVILELAYALGFSELWVGKLIEANKDNGHLTTAMALQVISKETGLTEDQILEEREDKASAVA